MAKRQLKAPTRPATMYLAKDDNGEFKFELPAGARLTFGPDVPFATKGHVTYNEGGQRRYSLRLYAGAGNDTLIACFSRVEWFRPLDMQHFRLVIREAGQSVWKSDERGYERTQSARYDRQFIDTGHMLSDGDGDHGAEGGTGHRSRRRG